MKMVKTLVADDESNSRNWLVGLLREHKDIEIVTQSASGSDTLEHLLAHNYDLVFLDISMPGRSGLEVCRELHQRVEVCPWIIFVTAFHNHGCEAWNLGAVDYLVKPVSELRLSQALSRFRSYFMNTHLAALPPGGCERVAGVDARYSHLVAKFGLTDREAEICTLVAEGKLHEDIRKELNLSVPTLKTHFSHIYQKTGLGDSGTSSGGDKFSRLLYLLFTYNREPGARPDSR